MIRLLPYKAGREGVEMIKRSAVKIGFLSKIYHGHASRADLPGGVQLIFRARAYFNRSAVKIGPLS